MSEPIVAGAYLLERVVERGCCSLAWQASPRWDGAPRHVVVEERRTAHGTHAAGDAGASPWWWLRTAQAAAVPDMPVIHAVHAEGDHAVVAREPLPGETVAAVLARTAALDPASVHAVAQATLDALAGLHAAGLAHGSPDALRVRWLADPRVVLDLPSPHRWEPATTAVLAHHDPIALSRVAPERLAGAEPTARADLFVWAALVLELATGRPPFLVPDDGPATARRVRRTAPSGLEALTDPALRALVAWSLAKDPAERPEDAGSVRAALAVGTAPPRPPRSLGSEATAAPPPPPTGPSPARRRWRRLAWAASLSAVTLVLVLIAALADDRPAEPLRLVALPDPSPVPRLADQADDDPEADGADADVLGLAEVTAASCAGLHEEPEGAERDCAPRGLLLPVIGQEGDWLEVAEPDGASAGWVRREETTIVDAG